MRLRRAGQSSQNPTPVTQQRRLCGPEVFCNAMKADSTEFSAGKFTGLTVDVAGLGKVELREVLQKNAETTIYYTENPGIVIKTFDLSCGKADEISYGPYLSWGLELSNFQDILAIEDLRPLVPAYYGANIDYNKKYAFVAMEYLAGQDLKSWCEEASNAGFEVDWVEEFKEAVYEALSIMTRFHSHGIVLIDFKPDNIIRLREKGIRLVDLGAFFTPRHYHATDKYLYSATPDYAELLIDASNVQAGLPPTEASDIFSAGVALFEMATGASRLEIDGETADEILNNPAIFLFRDSQIRDIWQSYPHLKDVLPVLETQLRERRILLAGPIAQATVLRSIRLKRVADLMKLIANRVSEAVREDMEQHNCLIQYLRDLQRPVGFVEQLSAWEARLDRESGHWAIAVPVACAQLMEDARFTFLKQAYSDEQGHRYFQIVGDFEADGFQDGKLTLWHLRNDHFAWTV